MNIEEINAFQASKNQHKILEDTELSTKSVKRYKFFKCNLTAMQCPGMMPSFQK